MGKTTRTASQKITLSALDDKNIYHIIETIRKGVDFTDFMKVVNQYPFSLQEWSSFLHLSERTLQRYKKEERLFDPLQSERIIQINLLFQKGIEVFGTKEKLNIWLEADNLALGRIKPKDLLDNTFGINLLFTELNRIEHGILA